MSLFLGKIHYWLFNKIVWFQGIEEELIDLSKKRGLDTNSIIKLMDERYGEKLPKKVPLEDMIDTGNIHGWLQSKIISAEGRIAALTTIILNENKNYSEDLEQIYYTQGIKASMEVKLGDADITTAPAIFNSINDYLLDGMPCDRVNEIVSSEDNEIVWTRRICVHKDIWQKEKGDVDYFYHLRSKWSEAFVNEVNPSFRYIEKEDGSMVIKRI